MASFEASRWEVSGTRSPYTKERNSGVMSEFCSSMSTLYISSILLWKYSVRRAMFDYYDSSALLKYLIRLGLISSRMRTPIV